MKTSLKERKYVEMHISILESGDGGTTVSYTHLFGLCFISSFVWDCLRFLFLVRIPIYSSLTLFPSIKKVERKTRQKVDESMNPVSYTHLCLL